MTAIEQSQQTEGENELELPRIIPDSFDSESDSRNPNVKVGEVISYGGLAAQASILGDSLFNQVAEVGGIFFESENKFAVPVGDQNNAKPVRCNSHGSHTSEGEGIGLDGNAGSRAEINGKVGGLVITEGGDVGEQEVAKYQVPVGNNTKFDEAMDDLNSINPVNVIISDKIQSKMEILGTLVSVAPLATDKRKKFTGRKELYDNGLSHPRVLMESLEYNFGDSSKQNEQCRRGQKNMPLKQKLRHSCKNMYGKENKDQEANNSFPKFEPFFVEDKEGSGGYGTVYSAQRKNDGKKFAIKCPHANANVQHANREREVLKRFGGRNFIIKYEGSFKNGNDECLILQHIEHDRPEVLRKEINIYQLQWYGYCMFRALASLHKEGMVHRDVKPANFLFSRNLNKGYLIDFNLAMDLHQKYSAGKSKLSHKTQLGTKDATSMIATSAEKSREPIPSLGRKELISLVEIHNAMRSPNRDAVNILGSQRKRIATPLSQADTKKIHFSPMPLHSAGIAVPGAGLLRSKDEKSKRDGPCVGTKGFRAPEALFRSLYQSSKVDIWSAGVTLLYLILGKTPFLGDPEQLFPILFISLNQTQQSFVFSLVMLVHFRNMKDITKLKGSEDLWELAKLHNHESAFPAELLDIQYLPSMDLRSWCKKNTKRPEFFKLIPISLFDLVDKCLTVNPRTRISADEALRHEFFAPCHEILTKQRKLRQGPGSASASELR